MIEYLYMKIIIYANIHFQYYLLLYCNFFFLPLLDANFQRNLQNIILPLDRLSGPLDFAWGTFKILYTVHRDSSMTEAYRKVISKCIQLITFFCYC